MFPISSLLVHLLQEDLLLIKTDIFDKQIMARTEQLNLTKRKVEGLKESIMVELQHLFPLYVDTQIISSIKHNANIVNEIPEEKLVEFKKAVLIAKENAIKRVMDELLESQEWFSCEKRGIDVGGGLWYILKSIEKEFLPLFRDLKFKKRGASVMGATDLTPLNLAAFESEELQRLNQELIKILEDYCGEVDSLKDLQNSSVENKAIDRWKNTGTDRDNNFVHGSRNQLDY